MMRLRRMKTALDMSNAQWQRAMIAAKMSDEAWNDLNRLPHFSEDVMIAAKALAGYRDAEYKHKKYNIALKVIGNWLQSKGISMVCDGVRIESEKNLSKFGMVKSFLKNLHYAPCVHWMRKAGYQIVVPEKWEAAVAENEKKILASIAMYRGHKIEANESTGE